MRKVESLNKKWKFVVKPATLETLSKAKAVLNAIAISHHTTLKEIM